MIKKVKKVILKWYPIIIALIFLTYSVSLSLLGKTVEASYTAHWPGTVLLFTIAIILINNKDNKK